MDVLRTPDEAFANLPGYPFAPHYTEVDDLDGGTMRIHHVDEGPADAAETVLLMHGEPSTHPPSFFSVQLNHVEEALTVSATDGCR